MQSKLKKQTTQKDSEALLQFGVGNGEWVVEERTGKNKPKNLETKHKKDQIFQE